MYLNGDLVGLPEMDFHCRGCIKFWYFVHKKLILCRYTVAENMIFNILFMK